MNFDRLAPSYQALEMATAGGKLRPRRLIVVLPY